VVTDVLAVWGSKSGHLEGFEDPKVPWVLGILIALTVIALGGALWNWRKLDFVTFVTPAQTMALMLVGIGPRKDELDGFVRQVTAQILKVKAPHGQTKQGGDLRTAL
jgi:hypothetical protein